MFRANILIDYDFYFSSTFFVLQLISTQFISY